MLFKSHPVSFDDAATMGMTRAYILGCSDGDTPICLLDMGAKIYHENAIRVAGLLCAECDGKEKELGLVHKAHAEGLLKPWTPVLLRLFRTKSSSLKSSIDRYIGEIWIVNALTAKHGTSVSFFKAMIDAGMGDVDEGHKQGPPPRWNARRV
jgi:hypothetical protein